MQIVHCRSNISSLFFYDLDETLYLYIREKKEKNRLHLNVMVVWSRTNQVLGPPTLKHMGTLQKHTESERERMTQIQKNTLDSSIF